MFSGERERVRVRNNEWRSERARCSPVGRTVFIGIKAFEWSTLDRFSVEINTTDHITKNFRPSKISKSFLLEAGIFLKNNSNFNPASNDQAAEPNPL